MIDDALRALEPQLGPAESEPVPLDGGITNRNFRVRFGGRDCVVRLPGKDTELLGIDREAERAATAAAAAIGVAPEVVAFLPAARLPGHARSSRRVRCRPRSCVRAEPRSRRR